MGLAIAGIAATATVFVLLGRLIRSTEEVARLLRTERSSPVVVVEEEDASVAEVPPSVPDAAPDAGFSRRLPRSIPPLTGVATLDDGGALDGAVPTDAADEDGEIPNADAGLEPEAAPLVEAPEPVRCGWRICPEGEVCCNWSCSTCAPPGATCSYWCGAPSLPISIPCGPNTCNVTEICCNRSCGICVPSGGTCSQEFCRDTIYDPFSASCGLSTCNVGQRCCDPRCGFCGAIGEDCPLDACP